MTESPPQVFISYSHDSEEHKERVLALSQRLRHKGIETSLDRYINGSPAEGWPLWMERQIERADFVLLICTPTYLRRVKRQEPEGIGRGATWEAALIYNELYGVQCDSRKLLPVLLLGGEAQDIPKPLQGYSHFRVAEPEGFNALYRLLTGQPEVIAKELGGIEKMSPKPGTGTENSSDEDCSEETLPDDVTNGNYSGNNPFLDRGRITDLSRFFGRVDVLRVLFDRLRRGTSCSLVGESQVGKSSILSVICNRGPSLLGLSADAFVYVDMQLIRNEDEFFEELCYQLRLGETLRGRSLFRRLEGSRYVICIDEIEKMGRRENFTGDERTELRGLAGAGDAPLTLAIASRATLEVLFEDRPGMTSPLAGICSKIDVGGFSPLECQNFLEERLQGTGVEFSDGQVDELIQRSGGHPGRLQRAAEELFDSLAQ